MQMTTARAVRVLMALLALSSSMTPATAQDDGDDDKPPWFTGPLLVPGAQVVGAGGLYFQPYFYVGEGLGIYNNGLSARRTAVEKTLNLQLATAYGITERFEVQVEAQVLWNGDNGESDAGAGDTQLELHYALADDDPDGWMPAVRADYVQIFPTGEFENLDASRNGTDARGSGSFAPTFQLNFMKTFHLGGDHFFRPDVSLIASVPLDGQVHGLNVYGGGDGTDGTVHPGNAVTAYVSGEYSLTRHWAIGFDSTYTYVDATHFTGNPGVNPDGTPAEVGVNSSYQITLSPQLEYNFDGHQGLVMGPWFTVVGKGSEDFLSFVISYAVEFDTPPLF